MRPDLERAVEDPSPASLFWLITLSMTALMAYFVAPVSTEYANEMLPSRRWFRRALRHLYTFREMQSAAVGNGSQTDSCNRYRCAVGVDFQKNVMTYDLLPVGRPDEIGFRIRATEEIQCSNAAFGLGRTLWSRRSFAAHHRGARISLSVGFVAVFISLLIGVPLGAIADYGGRGGFLHTVAASGGLEHSHPAAGHCTHFGARERAAGRYSLPSDSLWVEVARVLRGG